MSERSTAPAWRGAFRVYDLHPRTTNMREEVIAGLSRDPKRLPPKYFYDTAGSILFERITRLPEYYLTRTEMALFDAHLEDLARALEPGFALVEYGSGSTLKVRKLLERLRPAAYVPVDISGEHLVAQARALHQDFPSLDVFPTCADYSATFALPAPIRHKRRLGFFPGSSIGNFDPAGAETFLANANVTLGSGSRLLIGVDRKKDVDVLENAYNDSLGVTAEFNRNVLQHINDRLGADFDPGAFEHEARYDAALGCIQMFLRSLVDQTAHIDGVEIRIGAGERIHTENSFKYDPDQFLALARRSGFEPVQWWTDAAGWFGLFLLEAT
jgi:L-histidine Nalpha-methyltransferase